MGVLQEHILSSHSAQEEGPLFGCGACGEVYGGDDLQAVRCFHRHTSDGPFVCPFCEKSFATYASLSSHERSHGERSHACGWCGKAFTRSSHLQRHVKCVHEGERPYTCELCGKTFARKADLHGHEKVHSKMDVQLDYGSAAEQLGVIDDELDIGLS